MRSELSRRRCGACVPGTLPISKNDAIGFYEQIDQAWALSEERLTRKFTFSDFGEAFAAATRIALISETEGHHPDMEIGWGYLRVTLTTHAARGLTANDFIMAAKIDSCGF